MVWRSINPSAQSAFEQLWDRGVFHRLIQRGLLIESERVVVDASMAESFRGPRGEVPSIVLRHPKVPFFSYPYEWTFLQLKEASLAHLDLQIEALDLGVVLSDATPYNMQPVAGRMRLVDALSLRSYREGELWAGYNQFCRMFLIPLLVEAWAGMPFQPLLRGALNGMRLCDVVRILPRSKRWGTLNGLMHLTLHAQQERAHSKERNAAINVGHSMSRARYRAMLTELRKWIEGLKSRRLRTYWNDYAADNSYDSESRNKKKRFVAQFVKEHGIRTVWDLGGNSGDYSIAALDAGATCAIVLDNDLDALEHAYLRSRDEYPGLLPIIMDCTDPSPALGWAQSERAGLQERIHADAIFALALTHHVSIGRNVPPRSLIEWLVSLAPFGVVEFVPKQDPMVKRMLAVRDDVFHDYDEAYFIDYLSSVADVIRIERFAAGGRALISYRRKA